MSRADRSAVSVPYETLTALPSKMREASDSPQPARRAGEAKAGPGQGGWVPVLPRGPLTQSCPAVSGGVERPTDAGSLSRPPIAFRRNLVGAGTMAVMPAVTVLLRREGDVRPKAT